MFKVLSMNIGDKQSDKQLEDLLNSEAGWDIYDLTSSQGRALVILSDDPGDE